MKVEETVTIYINSKKHWNKTGIRVTTGERYKFRAAGEWCDLNNRCDADGYQSNSMLLRVSERLRRAPNQNWFKLIAAVKTGKRLKYYPIGSRNTVVIAGSGELACFANDVWGMYWNNSGTLELRVTRLQ